MLLYTERFIQGFKKNEIFLMVCFDNQLNGFKIYCRYPIRSTETVWLVPVAPSVRLKLTVDPAATKLIIPAVENNRLLLALLARLMSYLQRCSLNQSPVLNPRGIRYYSR